VRGDEQRHCDDAGDAAGNEAIHRRFDVGAVAMRDFVGTSALTRVATSLTCWFHCGSPPWESRRMPVFAAGCAAAIDAAVTAIAKLIERINRGIIGTIVRLGLNFPNSLLPTKMVGQVQNEN
jgi:hypothetical protein